MSPKGRTERQVFKNQMRRYAPAVTMQRPEQEDFDTLASTEKPHTHPNTRVDMPLDLDD